MNNTYILIERNKKMSWLKFVRIDFRFRTSFTGWPGKNEKFLSPQIYYSKNRFLISGMAFMENDGVGWAMLKKATFRFLLFYFEIILVSFVVIFICFHLDSFAYE